jgi:hypothetical protein
MGELGISSEGLYPVPKQSVFQLTFLLLIMYFVYSSCIMYGSGIQPFLFAYLQM